jgi:hypothetical protein
LIPLPAGLAARDLDLDLDFDLDGYADYRLVAPPAEKSWTKGGLGKTDFGQGGLLPRFGFAGLVGTVQVTPSLMALADVQFSTTDGASLSATEAYIRYRPVSVTRWRWSVKAGAFFPQISLENQGIGWTNVYTLTPSAINSWVGEELRTIGPEARLEWRGDVDTIEVAGSLYEDNDPVGEIMAHRGWSLSDLVYGLGAGVREPDVYARASRQVIPEQSYSFQEIDHRVGWYGEATWRSAEYGRVTLIRYDNGANPSASSQHGTGSPVFAWRTEFWSLGAQTQIRTLELLAQGMTGSTLIVPTPTFRGTTDFQAGYLLAAMTFGAWQPAVRFDMFGTQTTPRTVKLGEHGNAATIALNWRPLDWLRLTGEVLRVQSWRVQRLQEGLQPGTIDTQGQFAVRVFF